MKPYVLSPPNEIYLSRAFESGGVLNRGRLINFNSQLDAARLVKSG